MLAALWKYSALLPDALDFFPNPLDLLKFFSNPLNE